MTVTLKKHEAGSYNVRVDGWPTDLMVRKDDESKRWGAPQQWDVWELDPEASQGAAYLFTVKGLDDAKRVFAALDRAYGKVDR